MNPIKFLLEKPWIQKTASGLPLGEEAHDVSPPQKIALMFFFGRGSYHVWAFYYCLFYQDGVR